MQHRTKNNFASVEAFLQLQLDKLETPEARDAVKESLSRVSGMRMLYSRLQESETLNVPSPEKFLEDVARSMLRLYSHVPVELQFSSDSFELNERDLSALGTICVELMTNSFKYAFAVIDHPRIDISFRRTSDGLRFDYRDNGPGLPADFAGGDPRGFGLRLIEALATQLGGTCSMPPGGGTGASCTIIVPQTL
jgi:two-component sensor histidine kinase